MGDNKGSSAFGAVFTAEMAETHDDALSIGGRDYILTLDVVYRCRHVMISLRYWLVDLGRRTTQDGQVMNI